MHIVKLNAEEISAYAKVDRTLVEKNLIELNLDPNERLIIQFSDIWDFAFNMGGGFDYSNLSVTAREFHKVQDKYLLFYQPFQTGVGVVRLYNIETGHADPISHCTDAEAEYSVKVVSRQINEHIINGKSAFDAADKVKRDLNHFGENRRSLSRKLISH